jgi:hypothetical protein
VIVRVGDVEIVVPVDRESARAVEARRRAETIRRADLPGGPGDRRDRGCERDLADGVIGGVGDERVLIAVDHDAGRLGETGAFQECVDGTGESGRAAGGGHFPSRGHEAQRVRVYFGDEKGAVARDEDARRSHEAGEGRDAIDIEIGAGHADVRRHDPCRRNPPDRAVTGIGDEQVAARIQGQVVRLIKTRRGSESVRAAYRRRSGKGGPRVRLSPRKTGSEREQAGEKKSQGFHVGTEFRGPRKFRRAQCRWQRQRR